MIRRRHLLYVLAALAVPIPAFGIGVGSSAAQPLDVAVTLDQCGIASTTVVCKLDATYNSVDGARYYSAAVTGPDGSVVDYGDVSSGGTSLWVPYVGDGTYTVTVSAWGDVSRRHKPKPLATGSASAGNPSRGTTSAPGAGSSRSQHGHVHATAPTHATTPGQRGSRPSHATGHSTLTPATPVPSCTPAPADPPPPTPTPPPDPSSGDPGSAPPASPPGMDGVSSLDQAAMQASGELPSGTGTAPTHCPDPVITPDGQCCPDLGK